MRLHKTTLVLAVLAAAACSRTHTDTSRPEPVASSHHDTGNDRERTPPPQPATETPPPPSAANTTETLPAGASVEAPAEYKTTDDEIFGVLETINDARIEEAQLAKKWAKNQRVKKYAAMLIEDHTAANKRQKELRDRLGLRSTDSKLSDDIEGDSDQKISTMKQIDKGDPFDRSFVDVEVQSNASVLEFIDNKLMPHAQMPDLRQELSTFRANIEAHVHSAKDLQSTLHSNKT